MATTAQLPITQQTGTISKEQWDGLHTVEELDAALKTIIHQYFYA